MVTVKECALLRREILGAGEQARAARFRTAALSEMFVARWVMVRCILSRYVNLPAGELRVEPGEAGKPRLVDHGAGWSFNLSHTGDRCILAVTAATAVGVDIESCAKEVAWEKLAGHFFHAEEVRELGQLPEVERRQAFFRVWSRKEAYIKALGLGMSHGLDRFQVSAGGEGTGRLVETGLASEETAAWILRDFVWREGCVGALAVRGEALAVRQAAWGCAGGEGAGRDWCGAVGEAELVPVEAVDGALAVWF
jgi:4'-phosphopantetheinyl transferase